MAPRAIQHVATPVLRSRAPRPLAPLIPGAYRLLMRPVFALVICAVLAPASAASQQAPAPSAQRGDSARRDPTNTLPLVTTRTARFATSEGTWMSVDVSPDGRTLAFDLLGDIYTLPIGGGQATRIVGGNSVDVQPRFSPDGQQIVFVSDRNGSDATWIVEADGSRPRLLIAGGSHPVWSPDGRHIVTGNRMVDVRGGAGIVLRGVGTGASFTADGRYVWHQQGSQAARYDRQAGTMSYQTNLPGGVLRPLISRDGKSLAYFTRFETANALVVRNLDTGADKWVLMGTQQDAAGPAAFGPLPNSAWLPDESAIVTSFDGKLWRVDVPSGRETEIPFTATVEQSLGPLVRGTMTVPDSVVVREVREPALSPDGRHVAFSALGKVWTMELGGGAPRRLTGDAAAVESSPVWTPDGASVVYATWVDGAGGDIHQVSRSGGTPRNLTRAPAMYARIGFTPDGSRLVFARAPRHARTMMVEDPAPAPAGGGRGGGRGGGGRGGGGGGGGELNYELRWMNPAGGEQHSIAMVADAGAFPAGGIAHFTNDTSRVFFHNGTDLVSTRWDGSDERIVLAGAAPQTFVSPDGARVVSRAGRRAQIYLFDLAQVTDSLVVDPSAERPAVPVRRLTHTGGDFPAWSRDGARLVWSQGATIHVYDIARGERAVADSVAAALARTGDGERRPPGGGGAQADSGSRWSPAYDAQRFPASITVAADKPAGSIVLRGARVITMRGDEIIENADVVVTGNRIAAVGVRGRVAVPAGARVVNVAGRTILPGYVDINAQLPAPSHVHRTVVSQYLANLAYGVTTTRDPQSQSPDIFAYADRVSAGDLLGPRVFATGPIALDTAQTLRTAPETRDVLGVYANVYNSGTVRGDLNATRPDRQRFLTTSRQLGLTATALGGTDFRRSLSAILDGYADQQGAYEIFPLHGDVAKLLAEAGLTWAPGLLGRVGNRNGYEFIQQTEDPHADAKLRRFYPHRELDRVMRGRGTWIVAEEYPFEAVARGAANVVAAGGHVAIGSGGRVQGIGVHWDMWLLSRGGMSRHDVLRAATRAGAAAIGLGDELGSIEPGKLADLQVLDRNPLTDIRNTNSVRYVMKNGRLYDGNTLDQIAPDARPLARPWWVALEAEGAR